MDKKQLKKYLPILIFAVVQAVYHLLMREPEGSDAMWFFQCQLDAFTLKDYLTMRYDTWSSRLFIEAVLVYVSRHIVLWKILDWAFWIFLAWAFTELFPEEKRETAGYIILGFLLIYPLYDLETAGWIATSVNYVWPLALGIFSLRGTAQVFYGKKVPVGMWIVYGLAALYGANMEQMCAVILAVNGLAVLWFIGEKIPLRAYGSSVLCAFIAAAEFVFIMTCPGNETRKLQETISWMPNFDALNLLDKISMAFVDTMHHLIASNNLMYLCYMLFLAVLVFLKTERTSARFAALFPVGINLWFVAFPGMVKTYFPALWDIMEKNVWINGTTYHLGANYIPTGVYLLLIGCMLVVLTVICENWAELFAQMILLALGLATRMVMAFTPTIYVSQERTFFFLYMILGVSAVFFALRNLSLLQEKKKLYGALKLAGLMMMAAGVIVNLSKIGAA